MDLRDIQAGLNGLLKLYYQKVEQVDHYLIKKEHDVLIIHKLKKKILLQLDDDKKQIRLYKELKHEIKKDRESNVQIKELEDNLTELHRVLIKELGLVDKIILDDFDEKVVYSLLHEIMIFEYYLLDKITTETMKGFNHIRELTFQLFEDVRLLQAKKEENKEAMQFLERIVLDVKKKKIDTIVFLDRSARVFSYALWYYYRHHQIFNRPKIVNFFWHIYSKDDRGKNELLQEKRYKDLYRNMHEKKVIVVDDAVRSGDSLKSFNIFITEKLQIKCKIIYFYVMQRFYKIESDYQKKFAEDFYIHIDKKEKEDIRYLHPWSKGIGGVGFKGGSEDWADKSTTQLMTIFTDPTYKKYSHYTDILKQNMLRAKKHIQECVKNHFK